MKNEKKDTRERDNVDEHEKVVDVFVRLVLIQSAITPHVYTERLDFPCKERTWIHVQNPNLGPIQMADPNFPKQFVLKTVCTLRAMFQALNGF